MDPGDARRRWAGLAAIALFSLISAALFTRIWLASRNTLERHGAWKSAKVDLARGVMGAVAFATTRTALSRDRLSLGAWHGYQEVLWAEPIDLAEVSFDVDLDPGASFAFVHHRTREGFAGLRIDRGAGRATAFTASPDGAFTDREDAPLDVRPGNHRFRAVFEGDRASYLLDGALVAARPIAAPGPQTFGFRGGPRDARIDDVEIRARDGRVIREDFASHEGGGPVLAGALAVLAAVNLALLARRAKRAPVIFGNALLLTAVGLFAAADHLVISRRHATSLSGRARHANTIEDEAAVVERLKRRWSGAPRGPRVLFLGTSQTWGAGAADGREAYVDRIAEALDRGPGAPFEVINAGVSGSRSRILVDHYERVWIHLGPALTVVDLGTNDRDAGELSASLERLASLDAARGIRTLFVLEANDEDSPHLLGNHEVMRAVAARHGIPVVDLHRALLARRDDGFLWWDFVHPTSFGHRLAADALLPAVRRLLPAP